MLRLFIFVVVIIFLIAVLAKTGLISKIRPWFKKMAAAETAKKDYKQIGIVEGKTRVVRGFLSTRLFDKVSYELTGTIAEKIKFSVPVSHEVFAKAEIGTKVRLSAIEYRNAEGKLKSREWTRAKIVTNGGKRPASPA